MLEEEIVCDIFPSYRNFLSYSCHIVKRIGWGRLRLWNTCVGEHCEEQVIHKMSLRDILNSLETTIHAPVFLWLCVLVRILKTLQMSRWVSPLWHLPQEGSHSTGALSQVVERTAFHKCRQYIHTAGGKGQRGLLSITDDTIQTT